MQGKRERERKREGGGKEIIEGNFFIFR